MDALRMDLFTNMNINAFKIDSFKLIDSSMFDSEDKILNSLWIGLLGIETLMVVGVAVQSLTKRFVKTSSFKVKAH